MHPSLRSRERRVASFASPLRRPSRRGQAIEKAIEASSRSIWRCLRHEGFVTPDMPHSAIAQEFRVIKRPLITNVQGKSGARPERANLRDGDQRIGRRRQELLRTESRHEHRDGARQHGAAGRCRRGEPVAAEACCGSGIARAAGCAHRSEVSISPRSSFGRTSRSSRCFRRAPSTSGRRSSLRAKGWVGSWTEMSTRYPDRIVVFDSPPLLLTTEAPTLASHMGQIVMVVEAERTSVATREARAGHDRKMPGGDDRAEQGAPAQHGFLLRLRVRPRGPRNSRADEEPELDPRPKRRLMWRLRRRSRRLALGSIGAFVGSQPVLRPDLDRHAIDQRTAKPTRTTSSSRRRAKSKAAFATRVTPAIAIRGAGPRVRLSGTAAVQGLLYTGPRTGQPVPAGQPPRERGGDREVVLMSMPPSGSASNTSPRSARSRSATSASRTIATLLMATRSARTSRAFCQERSGICSETTTSGAT